MPEVEVNGATLHYEVEGAGPERIVFLHGLLSSGLAFDDQVQALSPRFTCATFDFRGQGRSPVTRDGTDMDTLAADAAAMIDRFGGPSHLVGHCMGGFVALRVALRRPDLVRSLTLIASSAEPEPAENMAAYRLLGLGWRWLGVRPAQLRWPVLRRTMPLLYGRTTLSDPARAADRQTWRDTLAAKNGIGAQMAIRGAIERAGLMEALKRIAAPTLIIVGEEDRTTPPRRSERLRTAIRGSRLHVIPRAGHTPMVEQPEAVNAVLGEFLKTLSLREREKA